MAENATEWVMRHVFLGTYRGPHGWVENIDRAIRFTTQQACDVHIPFEAEWVQLGRKRA